MRGCKRVRREHRYGCEKDRNLGYSKFPLRVALSQLQAYAQRTTNAEQRMFELLLRTNGKAASASYGSKMARLLAPQLIPSLVLSTRTLTMHPRIEEPILFDQFEYPDRIPRMHGVFSSCLHGVAFYALPRLLRTRNMRRNCQYALCALAYIPTVRGPVQKLRNGQKGGRWQRYARFEKH